MDQDAAYTAAARSFGAAIERLARGYEADAELRRDLIQEIHTALWRSFAYFEGQCSERSWVYRIAHNVAVTHIMTRRRLKPEALAGLDEIAALAAPADTEAEADQRRIVARLLATIHRLKPKLVRQRDALASIGFWYLAPFAPGLALMILAPGIRHGLGALDIGAWIALAVNGALFGGIWWLNRRAAKMLQRAIGDLDALEDSR